MRAIKTHATNTDRQAGFTVLELMVATSVFGVVLLVLTAGVLSFSRDYFAGIRRSNTQTVARTVIDDISRNIRLTRSVTGPSTNGRTTSYCLDNNVMYIYAVGREVAESADPATHKNKYGLIKRTGGCTATPDITDSSFAPDPNDQELLATNMRISNLSIVQNASIFTIKVRVAYGDDDLFGISGPVPSATWPTIACKARFATQFCAVSDLSSAVQKRFLL